MALKMFESFRQAEIDIVSSNGSKRHRTKALVDSKSITIPDSSLTILVGDEIRRLLPNGTEEAFEVLDPVFYEDFGDIPAHYQVGVRRKGAYPRETGGNYHFNISGSNARLNISSTDQSTNVVQHESAFNELIEALEKIDDPIDNAKLKALVQDMIASKDDGSKFIRAYQSFVAAAANHTTIIAPFLPALSQMLN